MCNGAQNSRFSMNIRFSMYIATTKHKAKNVTEYTKSRYDIRSLWENMLKRKNKASCCQLYLSALFRQMLGSHFISGTTDLKSLLVHKCY